MDDDAFYVQGQYMAIRAGKTNKLRLLEEFLKREGVPEATSELVLEHLLGHQQLEYEGCPECERSISAWVASKYGGDT